MKKLVTCLAALAAIALLRAAPALASDSGPPAGVDLSFEVIATIDNDAVSPSYDTIGTFTVTSAVEYILVGEPLNGALIDDDVGWMTASCENHFEEATATVDAFGPGMPRDTGDQRTGALRALPS